MADASDVQSPGGTGKQSAQSTQRLLYSAIVVDSFVNPAAMTDSQKASLKQGGYRVTDPTFVDKIPRNTISAVIVSDGASKSQAQPTLFYPFFSPHLCLPVKAGEKVLVMFEAGLGSQGYWLTRKSSDIDVDDMNYTHDDRTSQRKMMTSTSNITTTSTMSPSDAPTYPNGDETGVTKRALPGAEDYEKIVTLASATAQFTGEPVPRYSRQSPDLILQGSNNTLISMGQELTLDAGGAGLASVDEETFKGAIDIVVGRDMTAVGTPDTDKTASTTNAREYLEVHKRASLEGEAIVNEGVVDFELDLSRVYLTMKSLEGDARFGSDASGGSITALGDTTVDDITEAPFVVSKSDHPRIIARSDGSIKIVHQAGSNIIMDSSGNIQIQCAGVIEMGSTDNLEPFVRGDTLIAALAALESAYNSHTHITTATVATGPPGTIAPTADGISAETWAATLSAIIKGE